MQVHECVLRCVGVKETDLYFCHSCCHDATQNLTERIPGTAPLSLIQK